MINVTCYYLVNHPESSRVVELLQEINHQIEFNLALVDVEKDAALAAHFKSHLPVVRIGPYTLSDDISRQRIEIALSAARERAEDLQKIGDPAYEQRIERGRTFSKADRIAYWLSAHYLALFNLVLALYVGLAFMAPVLMKIGFDSGARIIYTIYSPFCHQLAFRSWFLFGEQAYYPRQLAGIGGVLTYEAISSPVPPANEKTDVFVVDARAFIGNETVGYKTALCERDIALYASILLFGILFAMIHKKIKPVPWYFWLLFGLLPIAIDGFSQFPGLLPGLPAFLPDRESTPFLRTLTGGLFGFFTAWYLFPLIEESMLETRAIFASKQIALNQLLRGK